MNQSNIKKFINENGALFWYIKKDDKENISAELLVETILSYGNSKSVKKLFELLGLEKVAEIFFNQISRKRNNYHKRTIHYFTLYFHKHA